MVLYCSVLVSFNIVGIDRNANREYFKLNSTQNEPKKKPSTQNNISQHAHISPIGIISIKRDSDIRENINETATERPIPPNKKKENEKISLKRI